MATPVPLDTPGAEMTHFAISLQNTSLLVYNRFHLFFLSLISSFPIILLSVRPYHHHHHHQQQQQHLQVRRCIPWVSRNRSYAFISAAELVLNRRRVSTYMNYDWQHCSNHITWPLLCCCCAPTNLIFPSVTVLRWAARQCLDITRLIRLMSSQRTSSSFSSSSPAAAAAEPRLRLKAKSNCQLFRCHSKLELLRWAQEIATLNCASIIHFSKSSVFSICSVAACQLFRKL